MILEPVLKSLLPHLSVNFYSLFRKIFRNIPDILKNFSKKLLKISSKSVTEGILRQTLGIGLDLVFVDRIDDLLKRFQDKFTKRIFTKNEILESNSSKNLANFYAKRFAAKEAFSKACGLGIGRGINFLDIEIANDKLGKPSIKVLNDKMIFLKKHFSVENVCIHVSLSDERSLASAMVLIEGASNP
jgi:holo-[acyl-carrier protein] synthase